MLAVVIVAKTHQKPFRKFIQILVKKRDSHRPHRKTFRFSTPSPTLLYNIYRAQCTSHAFTICLTKQTLILCMLIAFTVPSIYLSTIQKRVFFFHCLYRVDAVFGVQFKSNVHKERKIERKKIEAATKHNVSSTIDWWGFLEFFYLNVSHLCFLSIWIFGYWKMMKYSLVFLVFHLLLLKW